WADPPAWKQEKGSFVRKGGDYVMYTVSPTLGTFIFSAALNKGHRLQWVLNCTDATNYVLFQMDENNFYRTVVKNGQKGDEIKIPHKNDKKSFRTIQVRVGSNEIVHQIKQGESWEVLDRFTQPGANLSLGRFGFYIPGNDQVALSSFSHYVELNTNNPDLLQPFYQIQIPKSSMEAVSVGLPVRRHQHGTNGGDACRIDGNNLLPHRFL